MKPSGIGGQAVIEGIMMRNKNKYSIAVRKPDNEIEVVVKESRDLTEKHQWLNFPIIRGIVSFVDSLVTGISTINYSASFYDDPAEQEKTKIDEVGKNILKDKFESVLMAVTVILSIFFAIGLFMVLPYLAARLVSKYIISKTLLNFIEGVVRLLIFVIYILLISMMKDIKRTFMYHGAEHKCINCIENGARLTPENVKNSSRFHKRCGTSFLFLVMFISIIFFIFIRVDNTALQIVIRVLLIPVIAGVSYEVIRLAGKSDGTLINIVSKPGIWMQHLTTKEPDMDMIEVAIKAVEAVFDWKAFLLDYYKDSDNPFEAMEAKEIEVALTSSLMSDNKNIRTIKTKDLKKKHDYFCLWHQPQLSFSLPNGETYEEVVFRLNDFILEKYNENPQQTIFITIHGMLFTILHGIFLDLPVERLNEVNQEIVRGCSLSLFEFDGKKHKIDFIGKDCFLTPLKEKISYK